MHGRTFMALPLVAIDLAGHAVGAEPATVGRRPNILFLVADEYRHDCLGVAGHPIVKTPSLDGLARQGVAHRCCRNRCTRKRGSPIARSSSSRSKQVANGPGSDAVLDNSAVMPTLLELAGIAAPAGVQGRSLVREARGEPAGSPPRAFSVLHHRMVREGSWKLIDPRQDDAARPQLYNLADDPNEQRNLYGRPEVATVQAGLDRALREWWSRRPPAE